MPLSPLQTSARSRDNEAAPAAASTNQTKAQLRAILDTTVEGIIVVDERGIISAFNRAAQSMFGYRADEVIGCNVSMLMPEPYRSGHDQYMRNYLKTGKARIIGIGREALGQRKEGTVFPIELAVSEVLVNGQVSFTGLVRDITEQKRLDREILEVSEREQQRIGYDLHDGLCQELAGVAFLAQTMEQKLSTAGTVSARDAAQIRRLIQDAVRHARGLSRSLYPVDPQPHGLRVALQQLAANASDLHKMTCTFHGEADAQLQDSRASTHLYRIAQEAVRDAIHHGKASCIRIELSAKDGVLIMSVADNGLKLSEDGRYREEMVLRMMKHRARVIGAKLVVGPRSSGAKVVCALTVGQHQTRAKHG